MSTTISVNDGDPIGGDGNGNRSGLRRLFGYRNGDGDYGGYGYPPKRMSLWEWAGTPDSAALHALLSGALWFVVGTTLGLTMSHELTLPDMFAGIGPLVFSRLRPTHINTVLFGFLSVTMFGAWYYIVPRLCQTQLRSDRAANIFLLIWNLTVLAGDITLLAGLNQGKEYSEYPWYIDWIIVIGLLWNGSMIFSTIAARREPKMYVSLWYIGGTLVWIPIMYAIGNVIWHPWTTTLPNGQVQYSGALFGLNDAVWNWFYGHNVFGLYITTGGLAVVYYMVPKLTRRPLYSHTLSLIGFWTIALFYSPTGQHHLLQAPIPDWLKVLAIVGSVALIVPVFTFNANVYMSMRGAWGLMLTNVPLRFLVTGGFFYLAVSFQGSVQSLMVVNRFIHFTQWVVAHAHLALLGAFGFILSAAVLWMVPQITRKPLWSRNLADAQYWFMLAGIMGFFWSITAAGLAQASAWISLGQQVVRAYPVVMPYFFVRSVFGAMIWIGAIMMLVNVVMTLVTPAPDETSRRMEIIARIEEDANVSLGAATVDGHPVVVKGEAS